MSIAQPIATFRPICTQGRWQVEVTWSDGRVQLLSGYATQDEAKSWITFHGDEWTKITLEDKSSAKGHRMISGAEPEN